MTKRIDMDLLLLYVREDGLFARFLPRGGGEAVNVSARETVTEECLFALLSELMQRVSREVGLLHRRVTVVYALSRRVEVLRPCIAEQLWGFRFSDSVSELSRDELLYRAAVRLSGGEADGLLYCDTRETRLFTRDGEIPLRSGRTGGNGFYDWLLSFVTGEGDSFSHFEKQSDRMRVLFSAYRCYPDGSGRTDVRAKRIFPDRATYSSLYGKRADRDGAEDFTKDGSEAPVGERIDYTALTPAERTRVDRKYPALYRKARDKRGRLETVSMGEATERFSELFTGIEGVSLSRLVLVGHYADFPLTVDFLSSLPSSPTLEAEREEALLLDGMEEAAIDRIAGARLLLHDIDGDAVMLWEAVEDDPDACPEKRVSFHATVRSVVSAEDFKKRPPRLPYTVELEELRRDETGAYKRVRVTKVGDFRDFCYKRQRDGSYRLRFSSFKVEEENEYSTVLLAVTATPNGVHCRVLMEEREDQTP